MDMTTLSEDDRRKILEWNLDLPEPIDARIYELFAAAAQNSPNAPAICSWDGDYTYQDLDLLSTRLAHHFGDLGLQPEQNHVVAIHLPKCKWVPVLVLAILKAGGIVMPRSSGRHLAAALSAATFPYICLCISSEKVRPG